MNRTKTLSIIRERTSPWDVVVVGGGATGVGCALDAASRGYEVLLLEQHDFGKGTSSRSTKLIHGGVRYLRQGDFSLVREALHERAILLRNAPHTVKIQSFIVPSYGRLQQIYYGLGLKGLRHAFQRRRGWKLATSDKARDNAGTPDTYLCRVVRIGQVLRRPIG